jgi:hypothetical protein
MKKLLAIIALSISTASAFAASLENIIEPFALPANADYTAGDWNGLQKIKGVKWRHTGVQMTPVGFSKNGAVTLNKLGKADVFFQGARTMVLEGSVSISESVGKIFEKEQFDAVMKDQFSPSTSIKKLRGGCPGEGGISGDALYEVNLNSKKPVYVLTMTDAGGNSPNSRSSTFLFSLQNEQRWRCGR